jgi:hypothetical protein
METWLSDRDRPLLPAYGRADKRAMAAGDATRRSGPAPAGLKPSSRASPSMRLLSVGFGSFAIGSNQLQVRSTPLCRRKQTWIESISGASEGQCGLRVSSRT